MHILLWTKPLPRCKGYGFVDVDRPEAAARLCLAIAGFHFPNSGQKRTQVYGGSGVDFRVRCFGAVFPGKLGVWEGVFWLVKKSSVVFED